MIIEITRGRSEIYDILTHLTFLFIVSHKISNRVLIGEDGETKRNWVKLEIAVCKKEKINTCRTRNCYYAYRKYFRKNFYRNLRCT